MQLILRIFLCVSLFSVFGGEFVVKPVSELTPEQREKLAKHYPDGKIPANVTHVNVPKEQEYEVKPVKDLSPGQRNKLASMFPDGNIPDNVTHVNVPKQPEYGFRKSTHSNSYPSPASNLPFSVGAGIAKSMRFRALSYCSEEYLSEVKPVNDLTPEEKAKLEKMFNGTIPPNVTHVNVPKTKPDPTTTGSTTTTTTTTTTSTTTTTTTTTTSTTTTTLTTEFSDDPNVKGIVVNKKCKLRDGETPAPQPIELGRWVYRCVENKYERIGDA